MKTPGYLRTAAAAVALSVASAALGSEATGTEAVGEMSVSGGQFGLIVGGLAGLGLVVWLVTKVVSK